MLHDAADTSLVHLINVPPLLVVPSAPPIWKKRLQFNTSFESNRVSFLRSLASASPDTKPTNSSSRSPLLDKPLLTLLLLKLRRMLMQLAHMFAPRLKSLRDWCCEMICGSAQEGKGVPCLPVLHPRRPSVCQFRCTAPRIGADDFCSFGTRPRAFAAPWQKGWPATAAARRRILLAPLQSGLRLGSCW